MVNVNVCETPARSEMDAVIVPSALEFYSNERGLRSAGSSGAWTCHWGCVISSARSKLMSASLYTVRPLQHLLF